MGEYYTIKDLADRLNVSQRTIYNLVERDELPRPIKVGSRTMFKGAEVAQKLDGAKRFVSGEAPRCRKAVAKAQ